MKKSIYKSDVLVVGGGIAGVAAALSAAREGKKVILAESLFSLGGLATNGLIAIYLPIDDGEGNQVSFGLAEELLKLSIEHGTREKLPLAWLNNESKEEKIKHRYITEYDPNLYALLLEKTLKNSGISIIYGVTLSKARTKEGFIKSVDLVSRTQQITIKSKTYIDATGDATLCDLCNEETKVCERSNYLAAWYFEMCESKNYLRTKGSYNGVNPLSKKDGTYVGLKSKETSDFMIDSHQFILKDFLKNGEGSKEHAITMLPNMPQLRMTRRLVGKSEISLDDNKKYNADSVGMFPNWIKPGYVFELPYTSLIGNKINNLAVAGRCISVKETEMWDIARVIPVCSVTGEASGLLAAMYEDFRNINISDVQQKLLNREIKLHYKDLF